MEISDIYSKLETKLDRVSTDTRLLVTGDVFFALKGPHYNGNEFVAKALELGASFVICEDYESQDARVVSVDDALITLQRLAQYHRSRMKAKIIAITGSNGKTTTKELLLKVFETTYEVLATEGNLNNHIGVPLTLLKLKSKHDFLILEMGANHVGEIAFLCTLSNPDFGLITSIGKAHLEGFGNLQGVLKTKMELFDYLDEHQGVSFYNLNDAQLASKFISEKNHVSFGDLQNHLNYSFKPIQYIPTISLMQINSANETHYNATIFGEHNYQNVIAAISIANYFNIEPEHINRSLIEYVPSNMRTQLLKWKSNDIILDAYNANPSSMEAAIKMFNQWPGEEKWIIIGKMAELGVESELEHQKVFNLLVNKPFQKIILIGPSYLPFTLSSNMLFFSNVEECKSWLSENSPTGKTILVKGSRSAKLESLLI